MKRSLLLIPLLFSSPALSQSWDGPGAQTVSYPGGGLVNYTGVVGDGSDSQGGTPPATSNEPADIGENGYVASDWKISDGNVVRQTGQGEDKARFVCNSSHAAREDPILFHGLAQRGHWHEFVGNTLAGKDSTYSSLRTTGKSTCPGGPINRTAYWHPLMFKMMPNGLAQAIRSDREVFYYTHNTTDSPKKTRLFNGYAFIGGANPSDPTNSIHKAEIPAGFSINPDKGPNGDGFKGWACYSNGGSTLVTPNAGGTYSPALQTEAGADPWGGRCTSGMQLIAVVHAPECWDGKNLTSPDGRSHVRYGILHNNSGAVVCPDGWWQVPMFEAKTVYTHDGWSDYSTWFLSSDRHGRAETNWLTPGSTFHFDWMNGWQPDVIRDWLVNCNGVKIGATAGNGAACDSSTIDSTTRLKGGIGGDVASPDTTYSNNPIVDHGLTLYNDGAARFYSNVAPGSDKDITLHHGVPPS